MGHLQVKFLNSFPKLCHYDDYYFLCRGKILVTTIQRMVLEKIEDEYSISN